MFVGESGQCRVTWPCVIWSTRATISHMWRRHYGRKAYREQSRVHVLSPVMFPAVGAGGEAVQRCSSLWRNGLYWMYSSETRRRGCVEAFCAKAWRDTAGSCKQYKGLQDCANTSRVIMNKECVPESYQVYCKKISYMDLRSFCSAVRIILSQLYMRFKNLNVFFFSVEVLCCKNMTVQLNMFVQA